MTDSPPKKSPVREVLERLEFGAGDPGFYCPICWEPRKRGHKPECLMAAALKELQP